MSAVTAECTNPDGAGAVARGRHDAVARSIAVFFPLDSNARQMVKASGAPARLCSLWKTRRDGATIWRNGTRVC